MVASISSQVPANPIVPLDDDEAARRPSTQSTYLAPEAFVFRRR
jgi:hypothetical protein